MRNNLLVKKLMKLNKIRLFKILHKKQVIFINKEKKKFRIMRLYKILIKILKIMSINL